MSLCPTPLPPSCQKEIQRLIALIPDTDITALVATEPAFQIGGFRTSKTAILRTRLEQIINGSSEISDEIRRVVARRSRSSSLTSRLTLDTLSEARHALTTRLGDEVFLVALLLDARQEVRAKAEAWLQMPQPFLPLDPAIAVEQLQTLFGDLAELLGTTSSTDLQPTREAWHSQKERLENRILDLQTENRRLKGVDDRLARVTVQLAGTEKKIADMQQQLQSTTATLREQSHKLEETTAELAREQTHREARLMAALDLALANEFHGWLGQARVVEKVANAVLPHTELLTQVEVALEKQQTADRHSGNRAVLADRRAQLLSAQQRVQSALRNALRQTPELKTIDAMLADELQHLATLLDSEIPATPIEQVIIDRFHVAKDNELPHLRVLLDRLAALGILDALAVTRLHTAFQKRLTLTQALAISADIKMEDRQDTSTHLGRALAGQIPAILLIDGHNVLFGLPTRYAPSRGVSLTDAEKRERLVSDIVRITSLSPSLRAWIVFDGPTRSDSQAASNVRITYSGGSGEHRADAVLMDNLRFFKSSAPETAVIIASNDYDLCVTARRLGAHTISVLELGAFF